MDKLDRLKWSAGFALVCHGARIGIRTNNPVLLELMPAYLPPGWAAATSPIVDRLFSVFEVARGRSRSRFHLIYMDAGRIARTCDLEEALTTLASWLNYSVATKARGRVFVHAGVVTWRGGALLIPGRSKSGKTELVRALVEAGATYYSDEFAVLDESGRVHPYAKPLSIRKEGGDKQTRTAVETLGGRVGTHDAPVRLVVLTEYRSGIRWRPRLLSPGEAVLAILEHTPLARVQPEFALAALAPVGVGALVLRGRRGEAAEITNALLQRLEDKRRTTTLRITEAAADDQVA